MDTSNEIMNHGISRKDYNYKVKNDGAFIVSKMVAFKNIEVIDMARHGTARHGTHNVFENFVMLAFTI